MARHAYHRIGLVFALLALAFGPAFAGCSGCQARAPLKLVPKRALIVVEVPSLRRATHGISALIERLAPKGPLATLVVAPKGRFTRRFGFDITSPRQLRERGLNPTQGMAAYVTPEGVVGIVLPLHDAPLVQKSLRKLFRQVFGSAVRFERGTVGSREFVLAHGDTSSAGRRNRGADEATTPAGWIVEGNHALVLLSRSPPVTRELLAEAVEPQPTIAANERFARARAVCGRSSLLVYVDGVALRRRILGGLQRRAKLASRERARDLRQQYALARAVLESIQSASLAWISDGRRASLRAFLGLDDKGYSRLRSVLSGDGDAIRFSRYWPRQTWLVARFALRPTKVLDWLVELLPPERKRELFRALDRFEQRNNLRLREGLLDVSAGRFGLALAGPTKLSTAESGTQPSATRGGGRQLPRVVFVAQVKTRDQAATLLDRLERYLVLSHTTVRTSDIMGVKSYAIAGGFGLSGGLRWGLHRNALLVADPAQFGAIVRQKEASMQAKPRSRRARRALERSDALALYVDFQKLGRVLEGADLPADTLLDASAVILLLQRLDDLLLSAQLADGGWVVDAQLRLR